jgi:type IV pilus assembly protein PilM
MLGFVQSFFAAKCNPIGVDFGSDCLRMAQTQLVDGEHRLVAAASADVPAIVRHDAAARWNFFVETCSDLLSVGKFRGRDAILALPASTMFIQHLRMPKMEPDAMKKALPWELRGKLPIDPSHAQLRHIVAGDVYEGQEAKSEVIVMAAAKEMVNQFLAAAARAKLDVIGMNVEPKSIVDCFHQIYRRKSDEDQVTCFVDIGCVASRAVIAADGQILFARTIPVGGDHFSRATATALSMKLEDAKILRVKIASDLTQTMDDPREKPAAPAVPAAPAATESVENSFALLGAGIAQERRHDLAKEPVNPAEDQTSSDIRRVTEACQEPLRRLVEELELCRRYYETTFPGKPVTRLIFVGGEARQKVLCQQIARQMSLAAQVGDPMVRVGKNCEIPIESGIDRKQPQPGWAVAIGLSMGAATVAAAASSK